MPLPKLEHPTYEVYLKSLDRTVKFRPFLVKEEKLLLMAKESDDLNDIVRAIKQIIRNCVLDDIDVDALPTFDVEMFFINLRVQSVGESAEMVYTCNNVIEGDVECGHKIDFMLDVRNVKYSDSENHTTMIRLSDTAGMKLNYPTLNFSEAELDDNFEDGGYSFVSQYLDYIYDSEQIYKKEDISEEELKEFIDNLTIEQVKQVRNFFTSLPQVLLEQSVTCQKCSYVHNLTVEGLLNFFE